MSFSSVSIQYERFVTRIILVNYEELFHHFFLFVMILVQTRKEDTFPNLSMQATTVETSRLPL